MLEQSQIWVCIVRWCFLTRVTIHCVCCCLLMLSHLRNYTAYVVVCWCFLTRGTTLHMLLLVDARGMRVGQNCVCCCLLMFSHSRDYTAYVIVCWCFLTCKTTLRMLFVDRNGCGMSHKWSLGRVKYTQIL